ncbi:winged helix-turn-helix transcriptional regulator [Spirosoma radiotolerans]|uniref:MarR family transcriptional regulator n=1 Tax=Spirosoma radiotolerans TaxID=1379870 RepID=A0A0E3V6M3_9BACT|nr:helix-turn-helix domain-containing protein [Spirosoma radiotolerans]AKD55147.1 MarR family transcriptional regulator [Spirosoma radiotolerans]
MPDFNDQGRVFYNPVEYAMYQIGGTWKMPILWRLNKQVMRYGELKKYLPHISHKMLSTQLRELEAHGFVTRTVYAVVPPKVEYTLTEKGKRAIPVIERIRHYGMDLMREAGIDPAVVFKKPEP